MFSYNICCLFCRRCLFVCWNKKHVYFFLLVDCSQNSGFSISSCGFFLWRFVKVYCNFSLMAYSSGSSGRVRGRAEKHEIYVAAFGSHRVYDLFSQDRGGGGHGPLGLLESTTGLIQKHDIYIHSLRLRNCAMASKIIIEYFS